MNVYESDLAGIFVFTLVLFCVSGGLFERSNSPRHRIGSVEYAIEELILAGASLALFGFSFLVSNWQSTYGSLVQEYGLHGAQSIVSLLVIVLGIFAQWFRLRYLRLYGIVEVSFAVCCVFNVSTGISPNRVLFSQWATLGGCTYIVARGLNNISESRRQFSGN